jgi:6-phospho-3-hexuloisomerase
LIETANFIMREVSEALEKVDPALVEQVVASLLEAETIFVYGVGRSGLVGKAFAVRLVQMGMDVHFVGDTTTPIVREKDLVFIISNTGETMSAVQTANIVRRIGAKVITVTSNPHSKLAVASNYLIEIPPCRDEQRKKLAPLGTVFEAAAFIMLDSLVPLLMNRLGQNESSMRQRHAIWV